MCLESQTWTTRYPTMLIKKLDAGMLAVSLAWIPCSVGMAYSTKTSVPGMFPMLETWKQCPAKLTTPTKISVPGMFPVLAT